MPIAISGAPAKQQSEHDDAKRRPTAHTRRALVFVVRAPRTVAAPVARSLVPTRPVSPPIAAGSSWVGSTATVGGCAMAAAGPCRSDLAAAQARIVLIVAPQAAATRRWNPDIVAAGRAPAARGRTLRRLRPTA